jgi:AcrR family transcriptional regulator
VGAREKKLIAGDADRRNHIVEAAGRLFAENGVAGTTVRMIGDAVGLHSGSLYHYFESKDDIVDAIIFEYFDELTQGYQTVLDSDQTPPAQLSALMFESFRSIARRPVACEIYRHDYKYLAGLDRFRYVVEATERVQRTWLDVIEKGMANGDFRADIDPRLFYRFARDAIWQTAEWYRAGGRYSIEQIAKACVGVLLEGFGSSQALEPPTTGG